MFSLDALLRAVRGSYLTIAVLALVALAALGVRSWLAARDASAQLAATVAAQKQLLDQASAREQQRDATLAKTLAGIAQAKRSVQTPAQAIAEIPSVLPPLPEPLSLSLPGPVSTASTAATSTPSESPSETKDNQPPPAVASVPQADLKPLYDFLQDCRACQAQFAASQADLADERSKVSALTTERDAAVKAARGGGFWSRVARGAKWFLIGGAAGALAAAAAHR